MKAKRFSLQTRIIIRLVAVFATFFFVIGFGIFFYDRATSDLAPLERMNQAFAAIKASAHLDKSGRMVIDAGHHIPDFVIRDESGKVLYSHGQTPIDPIYFADDKASLIYKKFDVPGNKEVNIASLSGPLIVGGKIFRLTLVLRITPEETGLDTVLEEWVGEFLPASVPLFLLLMVVTILTLRRGFRPLTNLLKQVQSIGPDRFGERLSIEGLPDELAQLILAINAALARIEQGFRTQQEFLADAAHELRTPLAILSLHLDTLPNKEEVKSLRADVDRMVRLVEQLLAVAKMEALTIAKEEVTDLRDLAEEVAELFAPMAAKIKRSIAVSGAVEPVLIRGNRDALYQAVRNLIENALRFAPEGTEVEIHIDSEGEISVIDRGPGIPENSRAHLFKRFWQSDQREGSGAGLGLTIAERIARAHSGHLSISDNPGGGAQFTLKLPLAR